MYKAKKVQKAQIFFFLHVGGHGEQGPSKKKFDL